MSKWLDPEGEDTRAEERTQKMYNAPTAVHPPFEGQGLQ